MEAAQQPRRYNGIRAFVNCVGLPQDVERLRGAENVRHGMACAAGTRATALAPCKRVKGNRRYRERRRKFAGQIFVRFPELAVRRLRARCLAEG
jgi:hypothetical protein